MTRNVAKRPGPMIWTPTNPLDVITDPSQAINVFDFEAAAFATVPTAHFAYIASGISRAVFY